MKSISSPKTGPSIAYQSATKAIFNWSGGKDSSLCLYKILRNRDYEIRWLLTTVNAEYQRISMHGVRVELLERQAASLDLPLIKVEMPRALSMRTYDVTMSGVLNALSAQGAEASIFGDIFLEDLRRYREERLAEVDLRGVFPLWRISTDLLAREFIDLGFKAIVVCVNDRHLDRSFVGREIDADFLNDLPEGVDPCGEYGEFHSFVVDGPIFNRPIDVTTGEVVHRKYELPAAEDDDSSYDCDRDSRDSHSDSGFWYCDLLPA